MACPCRPRRPVACVIGTIRMCSCGGDSCGGDVAGGPCCMGACIKSASSVQASGWLRPRCQYQAVATPPAIVEAQAVVLYGMPKHLFQRAALTAAARREGPEVLVVFVVAPPGTHFWERASRVGGHSCDAATQVQDVVSYGCSYRCMQARWFVCRWYCLKGDGKALGGMWYSQSSGSEA